MNDTTIGLDIGSSAVRAVEIAHGKKGPVLVTAGQVGLPSGAVEDGEVVDAPAVGEALRRLWNVAGFSSRKVVVGISSQRVIVRQAEIPAIPDSELRSALRFQAQDLIPIPLDEAVLDFAVLDRPTGPGGQMRILLAAASRDMVEQHLAALRHASLSVTAVEPIALALLRLPGLRSHASEAGAVDSIVSVGAAVTTVAVRRDGVPGFVRVLPSGSAEITMSLARHAMVEKELAEAFQRNHEAGTPVLQAAGVAVEEATTALVAEIGASLDFFLGQADRAVLDRIALTGGGAVAGEVRRCLAKVSHAPTELLDAFAGIDLARSPLDEAGLARLNPRVAAAVGLALRRDGEELEVNLLPDEVLRSRRLRKALAAGACGVGILLLVLAGASVVRLHEIDQAKHQLSAANTKVRSEQSRVDSMGWVTSFAGAAQAREAAVAAAGKGATDWVRVVDDLTVAMPPQGTLTSLSLTHPVATATASTVAQPATGGTITMAVTTSGGEDFVASWLRAMRTVPYLSDVFVGAATTSGGSVTFSSTASLGAKTPIVIRPTAGAK
jgi:type IV pilus assembly protein PilM